MPNVAGYDLKKGERVILEFTPIDECPVVGNYIIRTMKIFEVRDSEGNLVEGLLKNGCTKS